MLGKPRSQATAIKELPELQEGSSDAPAPSSGLRCCTSAETKT